MPPLCTVARLDATTKPFLGHHVCYSAGVVSVTANRRLVRIVRSKTSGVAPPARQVRCASNPMGCDGCNKYHWGATGAFFTSDLSVVVFQHRRHYLFGDAYIAHNNTLERASLSILPTPTAEHSSRSGLENWPFLSSHAITLPTQRRFPNGLFLCALCDTGCDRVQRVQRTLRKWGLMAWSKRSISS